MNQWKKVKLGEITESCLGKMLDAAKNRGEYQPYLANLNVRWGSFDIDNLSLMKFEDDEEERYGIRYGDLIICEGGEPGRCAIWKEQLPNMKIQKALHRVRPKDGLVDNFYLFYWFLHAGKRNWIDQYCTGATIKHLPGQKLKGVVVDLPPLPTQQRIATILSRYDSLIENYQHQIKLLEEAAQRLYKEWFVDLKFPGFKNTKIVDGVPEGWEKKKIGELVKTTSGGTPSRTKEDYYNGTILWVKTKELNDCFIFDTEEHISNEALLKSSAKVVPQGSILLAMYGATIGKLGIATKELTCNQACCVFLFNENDNIKWFLYNWLLANRTFLISQGKGAAQPNLSQDMIKQFTITLPSNILLDKYHIFASNIYLNIASLQSQIRHLTEARDRLLPKLMNGEIDVQSLFRQPPKL